MREERLVEILLTESNCIGIGEIFRDLGKGLIVLDQIAFAAQIVTDEVGDELGKSLTVAQDFRFQRFRKDGVGDNQCQNRWHPAGQEDRDNNVEALKTIKFQPDPLVSQLHTAGARR